MLPNTVHKPLFIDTPIQYLPTQGCHDIEAITFGERIYLFLSEDRNSESSEILSHMYVLRQKGTSKGLHNETECITDESQYAFELFQEFPTDGAHAAEFFVLDDKLHVAVANFG